MKDRILVGIPTRERPDYLSGVLATLMYQHETRWDLLIVDTAPTEHKSVSSSVQVGRFLNTLRALGHSVEIIERPNRESRSSVIAVNTLLTEAVFRGYGYFFMVDDDHTVPPETLGQLRKLIDSNQLDSPVLVSGVTPWMHKVWEGAAGPEDVHQQKPLDQPSDIYINSKEELVVGTDLFYRWDFKKNGSVVRSTLGSDANFMMKPDLRILQSDIGPSSLHAFSVWFLQLQALLDYRIFFDVSINVWHVAAPSGGVRDEDGNHVKQKEADLRRKQLLRSLLKDPKFNLF